MTPIELSQKGCVKTRLALLWMHLSSEPLIALYSLIPFILRSELGASDFQIALFTTLSPVLSVFSFYWGSYLSYRRNKLLPNLIGAWILARLPFLFFPWVQEFWLIFLGCAIYQLFSRASTPALMEILKRNIPKKTRENIFSFYYLLSVVEGVVLGVVLAKALAFNAESWKGVFFIAAAVSLTSVLFQRRILVEDEKELPLPSNYVTQPIKESVRLLQSRPDFMLFQWAYMIGGLSLMMIAPISTIFFADISKISLGSLAVAKCIFVGIGMAGSSFFWRRSLDRFGIHRLLIWILVGFGFFPILLIMTQFHLYWLYFAHLIYGVAQAGSHLIWHLSGTIFSQDKNSVPFTTVNVLMVGLRGAVGPFLGILICASTSPATVLSLGALLAFSGAFYLLKKSPAKESEALRGS